MKRLLLWTPVLLSTLLLSACATSSESVVSSNEPLISVGLSGGRCVDAICEKSFTVYVDGTTDSGTDVSVESIEEAIADSKLDVLDADPEPSCPSYADGQDITIQVAAWGSEVYKPCELLAGNEDPLALEAEKLLNELN
jgi:hypothetical protein